MQNQKSPPELPNSWRTGHAPLMSLLIIARTVGPRPQVFLQGETKCGIAVTMRGRFVRLSLAFIAFGELEIWILAPGHCFTRSAPQ